MSLKIHLLGKPVILDAGGEVQPVRGHQAWALLTRILLSPRPLDRRELAAELFPETVDPLGALRWCLASLRRALGSAEALSGDPIAANLPPETMIDVFNLDRGEVDIEAAGDLLDAIEPRSSPQFATWLLVERQRTAGLIDSRIRQEALQAGARGDHDRAVRLAERGVRRNPLDEGAHILLTSSLAAAGHYEAALAHVEATERAFLADLGEMPTVALRSAARRTVAAPPGGVPQQAVVRSLLDSGLSALAAGAADAGIDCLRRAAAEAESCRDAQLHAKALFELGTALVHAVRGYDDEGAILLSQAVELAGRHGYGDVAAGAYRELGYVDALAGRRPAAAGHLAKAVDCAEDDNDLAGIYGVMGFNLVDWGKVNEGLVCHELSLEHARSAGNRRREIWTLGLGGWGQLAAGHLDVAGVWLTDCLSLVENLRWTAFRPWPLAVLSETQLRRDGDARRLRAELEEAFALSCQLGDPCWEAAVARVLALCHEATDDMAQASAWLSEGRRRSLRETDGFVALTVQILADQAEIGLRQGDIAQAESAARELLAAAARAHMDAHVRLAGDLIQRCAR